VQNFTLKRVHPNFFPLITNNFFISTIRRVFIQETMAGVQGRSTGLSNGMKQHTSHVVIGLCILNVSRLLSMFTLRNYSANLIETFINLNTSRRSFLLLQWQASLAAN
jgi:predicted transcriptional regulator with HTH domain